MTTGALVAVGAVPFESDVLSVATRGGLHVVRRCVDVADLLATAATRQAGVALVSTGLDSLDTEVLARLRDEQVAVVGVVATETSPDAAVLRGLGVDALVSVPDLAGLAGVVVELLDRETPKLASQQPDGRPAVDRGGAPEDPDGNRQGQVVAVWGPTGAPGRSTVALGLASVVAESGVPVMLIDADVYGGSQAQLLGLLDEASGLLAASRSANRGSLGPDRLAGHARAVSPTLRVLTGLPRSDRWVELSPVLLRRVVEAARALADVVVLDCAFSVELDEEISYDTAAPRRNGATLTALELADVVVVVGAADPVGLGRLLRALSDLAVQVPGAATRVVVNRMRPSLGWSSDDVRSIVRQTSQLEVSGILPDDLHTCDRALVHGQSVVEAAPGSKLVRALRALTQVLLADVGRGSTEQWATAGNRTPVTRRRAVRAR